MLVPNQKSPDGGKSPSDKKKGTTKQTAANAASKKGQKGPKRKLRERKWFKVCLTVFFILVIVVSIAATSFMMYVFSTMKNDDQILSLENVKLAFTTIVYGKDGSGEEVEVTRLNSAENRIWVDYENIPENMIHAVVAVEDERFYKHHGVDWKRTIAATVNEVIPIYKGRPGGSTITQQLIKNITHDKSTNFLEGYARKAREIFRALNLEKMYSKEDILEAYLNTFHLGNNTDGVQAAAYVYFGKDVSELSLVECAAIAGMTQSPTEYNPFINPENNKTRRDYVLSKMLELGYITQEEYDEAVNTEPEFKSEEYAANAQKIESYFTDYMIDDVIDHLMEKYGYTKEEATNYLYTGGLRIYSTVDTSIQGTLESVYENDKSFPNVSRKETVTDEEGNKSEVTIRPESAAVVMDFEGNILGLVGGRGEKTVNRALNRAVVAGRSNGSTMKPLAAYGPAIEQDLITYSTVMDDSPVKTLNGRPWPKNYYAGYKGKMTAETALKKSVNTVAVRTIQKVGAKNSYEFLKEKLGITTLTESDVDDSLALGMLTDGISPLEVTAAYAVFGNGGVYYEPRTYTRVEDQFGNVVLDGSEFGSNRAFSESTAKVTNQMLQQVLQSGGTAASFRYGSMPLAGKTGTTDSDTDNHLPRDVWFVGMNPYYVTGVWWGYDSKYGVSESGYPPAAVWKNIMSQISSGKAYKNFPNASGVVQKTYCVKSGLLASDKCTETAVGWYKTSNIPETCSGVHEGDPPVEEEPKPQSSSAASSSGSSSASSSASSSSNSSSSASSSSKPVVPPVSSSQAAPKQ